ncbi:MULTISPECIES: hypothetical protein [Halorhodospira]|uniref:arsenate reductase/protein-tyrosine-phosphatase family protein n=1 Tax=Halorhodospira TaxID=85108 RepID=UPI00191210D1|nr:MULTISPECIES: hypothetical protein [Halorhodospira]MBK5936110.1 hypothetical protein [Halorhodospira halophila]MCG5537284.1 hypothetical protein [Halorhodospira sp. 9622]
MSLSRTITRPRSRLIRVIRQGIRHLLPWRLARPLLEIADLGPGGPLRYARCRFARERVRDLPHSPPQHGTILLLCDGNIFRSALAEALMRRQLAEPWQRRVLSAGLRARDGKPADPRARSFAKAMGLSLEQHGARQLRPEMIDDAAWILAMDDYNRARLLGLYPQARERLYLLGAFTQGLSPGSRWPRIHDPYHCTSGTERDAALQAVVGAVDGVLARLPGP